ncbi:hypothetical protein TPHA_0B02230 [Tetrapisispora phaffii CBS 4417]|uniref:Arrestin-like N-terminal domain-containing protein n=1 Tax=Tetrapisispora phaffii (strain ATCC 24235 / CBS 4417 / NBRC 1672 / NRRL Y-8282 / UCD 70-5) TaxID=1071381 RepID=G8BPG4_TETPH|nr:hypothetical protein TPHA_0B02230 [Tetrapisispora phaffii CBS 4417]CCE61895.1 hypothetical protein TPHA_0B02230 [Tetrapisispora phaffii CBS 4417]
MADIKLIIDPPINNEYFSNEDLISGTIILDIKKSLSIKKINVKLKGYVETLTKMSGDYFHGQGGLMTPVQDNRSIHGIIDIDQRVFPPDNVWDALDGNVKPFKVKPGSYDYRFQFPKLPKRPSCIQHHIYDINCFVKKSETRLPPSFNYEWQDPTKIDNLDIYFYSFGKVLYYIQVQLELGKSKAWYKPFNRYFTETEYINFIPDPKETMYKVDYDKIAEVGEVEYTEQNLNNSIVTGDGVNRRRLLREKDKFTIPHNVNDNDNENELTNMMSNTMLNAPAVTTDQNELPTFSSLEVDALSDTNNNTIDIIQGNSRSNLTSRHLIYKSTYSVHIGDDATIMCVEVRSRGLKYTYRRDFLFRHGSNKFDHIFLVFKGNKDTIRNTKVTPLKMQLNLLEYASYLSHGVANENVSSLRLIEVTDLNSPENKNIVNFEECRTLMTPDLGYGKCKMECELKLKDHEILKKLRFNKENYLHRGNRLFSFKCCTIKRIFRFQLVISWQIGGKVIQTENIINNAQIFSHLREKANKVEHLPRYVEPPKYTEVRNVDNDNA